jgi:integrase
MVDPRAAIGKDAGAVQVLELQPGDMPAGLQAGAVTQKGPHCLGRTHCSKAGLTDSTINRVLVTYRRLARRLVKWRVVPNPLPMPELTMERNVRDYVISADEETRLLAAAREDANPYVWLFIKLGLATSLRHSEMLSARFDGFDLSRRRLTVRVKGGRMRK